MTGGEKRDVVVTYRLYIKKFKKTHILQQRHDRKREKKYVVVTHRLAHQTIQ